MPLVAAATGQLSRVLDRTDPMTVDRLIGDQAGRRARSQRRLALDDVLDWGAYVERSRMTMQDRPPSGRHVPAITAPRCR